MAIQEAQMLESSAASGELTDMLKFHGFARFESSLIA